jgi:hypothetical protein
MANPDWLVKPSTNFTAWELQDILVNHVEMDVWDKDFLDLVETAHLTFKGAADGEIAFGAPKSFLDVRYGTSDRSACAEFSWQGNDKNDPASGPGWVVLGTAGRLVGHFYIHNGDDSGFVCDRA